MTSKTSLLTSHCASLRDRLQIRPSSLRSRTSARTALLLLLPVLLVAPSLPIPAQAQEISQRAIDRADSFFRPEVRGKEILGYLHLGAAYHGHRSMGVRAIEGSRDQFELVYRFFWEDDGFTDVALLCDANGYLYQLQVLDTNAVFNRPFLFARATMNVLGNTLIEVFKKDITPNQRKLAQKLVDDADAKGLLELSLWLEQHFG